MRFFYIPYQLDHKDRKDYQKLYDRLNELKAQRMMDSLWVLAHEGTQEEIYEDLRRHIHPDDKLAVIKGDGAKASPNVRPGELSLWVQALNEKMKK